MSPMQKALEKKNPEQALRDEVQNQFANGVQSADVLKELCALRTYAYKMDRAGVQDVVYKITDEVTSLSDKRKSGLSLAS